MRGVMAVLIAGTIAALAAAVFAGWVPVSVNTDTASVKPLSSPLAQSDGTNVYVIINGDRRTVMTISTNPVIDYGVVALTNITSIFVNDIAASSNGQYLVAAGSGTNLLRSADYGVTWTTNGPVSNWVSVAISATGSNAIAATWDLGPVFVSTNAGVTWDASESNRQWACVAASEDGQRLAAVVAPGHIHVSEDAGTNWVSCGPSNFWRSIAMSGDGQRLVAAGRTLPASYVDIYTSIDFGTNWAVATTPNEDVSANGVAISTNGGRLGVIGIEGSVWLSADAGTNWLTTTPRSDFGRGIAMSGSGDTVLALYYYGQPPMVSTNFGTNWAVQGPAGNWVSGDYVGTGGLWYAVSSAPWSSTIYQRRALDPITAYVTEARLIAATNDPALVRTDANNTFSKTNTFNRVNVDMLVQTNGGWEDMVTDANNIRVQGTVNVTANYISNTVDFTTSSTTNFADDHVYFTMQFPHSWKTGSVIYPHLHFAQHASNQTNGMWFMRYKWYNAGSAIPSSWTETVSGSNVFTYTGGIIHQLTGFGSIDGAGKGISSLLDVKIHRVGTIGSNTVQMKQFDVHIQRDSLGSDSVTNKSY